MVTTTKKLVEQMNEVVDMAFKSAFTLDTLSNMDESELLACKLLNRIMKTSGELMVKQAETIEEMNERMKEMEKTLDLLLDK